MRFAIITFIAILPTASFANSLDCSQVQYCVDHLAKAASAFPTAINSQITDDKLMPSLETEEYAAAGQPTTVNGAVVD